jgi:hypothetical protein
VQYILSLAVLSTDLALLQLCSFLGKKSILTKMTDMEKLVRRQRLIVLGKKPMGPAM